MNEKLARAKQFAKDHLPELVGASIVVVTATVTALIVRDHYESKIAFEVKPWQMHALREMGGRIFYEVEDRQFALTILPK